VTTVALLTERRLNCQRRIPVGQTIMSPVVTGTKRPELGTGSCRCYLLIHDSFMTNIASAVLNFGSILL
jgi:hypothetical protein